MDGLKHLINYNAVQNNRTLVDVIVIQHEKEVNKEIINKTLVLLTRKNISTIIHGNVITVKSPINPPSSY